MACATLKRTLDFDPLHSPGASPKRRRCSPLLSPSRTSMSTPPPKSCRQPSPFMPVSPSLSPGQLAANICLEWKRLKRRKRLVEADPRDSPPPADVDHPHHHDSHLHHPTAMIQQHMSGMSSTVSPFSSHLSLQPSQHGIIDSPSTSALAGPSLPTSMVTGAGQCLTPSRSKEQPMFTLRQVIMICERMLKDQESRIQGEYDKVLTCKLAEQYDSFVKFNQDQLKRRFRDSTASYVS